MNIINNLFGNMYFYGKKGRKGKFAANDKYELMHNVSFAGQGSDAFRNSWMH